MKIEIMNIGSTGFSTQDFDGGVAYCEMNCAGTSSGTAPSPLTAGGAFEYTLLANRIDDANYGIKLPQAPLTSSARVNVIANGPFGKSITVYVGPTFQLVDGATSLTVDCGKMKTFMRVASDVLAVSG